MFAVWKVPLGLLTHAGLEEIFASGNNASRGFLVSLSLVFIHNLVHYDLDMCFHGRLSNPSCARALYYLFVT